MVEHQSASIQSDDHLELLNSLKIILALNYLWPKKMNSSYKILVTLFLILNKFVCYAMIGHIILVTSQQSFSYVLIADDTSGIIASATSIFMVVSYLWNFEKIKRLLMELNDFTEYEKPKGIESLNAWLNLLSKYSAIAFFTGLVIVWFTRLLQDCPDEQFSSCGFMLTGHIPYFNIYKNPQRRIFMTLQIISTTCTGFAAFYISWLMLCISEFLLNRIKHLKDMLRVIKTLDGREQRKRQIKKCVQYHYNIIRIWLEYSGIASTIFYCHTVNTGITMSMIAYQLLLEISIINILHFAAWLFSISLACIYSERLINESSSLSYVVYDCMPFDNDLITSKDLMILTSGCLEMYIPTGNFGALSHYRLLAIFKTMYSFLTLLMNTKD